MSTRTLRSGLLPRDLPVPGMCWDIAYATLPRFFRWCFAIVLKFISTYTTCLHEFAYTNAYTRLLPTETHLRKDIGVPFSYKFHHFKKNVAQLRCHIGRQKSQQQLLECLGRREGSASMCIRLYKYLLIALDNCMNNSLKPAIYIYVYISINIYIYNILYITHIYTYIVCKILGRLGAYTSYTYKYTHVLYTASILYIWNMHVCICIRRYPICAHKVYLHMRTRPYKRQHVCA